MQEFFWTPRESITWLTRVVSDAGLWLTLSQVGSDNRTIQAKDLQPDMLVGNSADAIQFFLGDPALIESPIWRDERGRRELDFLKSYAVQFVPSVLTPDHTTLLEGRIAIFPMGRYDDAQRARKLSALYRRLRTSMKRASDPSRVIVQITTSGEKKRWPDMLVGKEVPDDESVQLKQFAEGEVVFHVEAM